MITVLPMVNITGKMLRDVDRIRRLRFSPRDWRDNILGVADRLDAILVKSLPVIGTDMSGSLLLFVAVWLYGTPWTALE